MPQPIDEAACWRILDAGANRAGEGLRVVEEYLRFALDDALLARLAKQLRHDVALSLRELPAELRHAARDTPGDVGTRISTPQEFERADAASVAFAGLKRVEQALRTLEEYSKVVAPSAAANFKPLRYRLYTLEKAVFSTIEGLNKLGHARLYVLLEGRDSPEAFAHLARELVQAGVHVLQLRDKRLDDRQLLARARTLREITQGTGTLFIMNDRADLAALSRADGVHVGQEELSVRDARAIVGPQALVGVSTHSLAQARQAVLDGASYLGVGPTFPSTTKSFGDFPGRQLLCAVAVEIRLPAFAIGGISRENLAEVLGTGFRRIAVSSAVVKNECPGEGARELLEMMSTTTSHPG